MLIITKIVIDAIRAEGEASYPNECCGFLFGHCADGGESVVTAVSPVVNAREDGEKYHRFVIEPEDSIKAELYAQKTDLTILGIYHSHPDHIAEPSEYELTHALPFYSYIIVAVEQGKSAALTSWKLSDDAKKFLFLEEDVNINQGE